MTVTQIPPQSAAWFPCAALVCGLSVGAQLAGAQDLGLVVDAAERQNGEAVVSLLAAGANPDLPHADGATALHWAAHWNDQAMALRLLGAGADPNVANELGITPLALAALNASVPLGQALLEAGANPNAARPSGETVLMTAARTGSADLVQALLEAGAEIEPDSHFRRQTPLMWAASEGHGDVVRRLLEAGAAVEGRSVHGTTPLLLAARSGDVDTARVLVEAGADVNATEPVLSFDARIDEEEAQTSGRSPLLVAAASRVVTSGWEYQLEVKPSTHEDFALYLLDQGADPDLPDSIGRTALHAAVETNKVRLVRSMLDDGADPNARLLKAPHPLKGDFVAYRRFVGATPLWLAAAARVPSVEILEALLDAGGNAEVPADDGTTPLMAAMGMVQNEARQAPEDEALKLVELLMRREIDLDAVDRRGRTAMHGAARLAKNRLIEVLASHGAEVSAADARGFTPLDVGTASRPLHPTTEALLRDLGAVSSRDDELR